MFSVSVRGTWRSVIAGSVARSGVAQVCHEANHGSRALSGSSSRPRRQRPGAGDPSSSRKPKWRSDGPGNNNGRVGRRTQEARAAAATTRIERTLENSQSPRFQQFGRPGGEGGRVAEGLYEEFGLNSLPRYSPGATDERQVLKWLEGEVNIGARAVGDMLEQEPRLVEQTPEDMASRLAWLKERLQLTEEQTRSLVHRRPSLLCRSVDKSMEPKVRWLQDELGLDDNEVAAMVTCAPNVLRSSVDGSLEPKLRWLATRLGLSQEELAMVVTACPQVMTSGIDGALEPRLRWLQDNLEIGAAALRQRVLLNPWLLNLGVEGKLAPTLAFLKDELSLEEADVRKLLFRNPRMFLTPLRPGLASIKKWLSTSLGMEDEQAVAIVRRDARLLLRSTEVLESKLEFFQVRMGATAEDVKAVLATSPNILLVSVELMLGPRVAALRKAGVDPSFALHWNELAFGARGEEFDAWVSRQSRRSRG